MVFPIRIIILIIVVAGLLWLQLFLSKMPNKWLGLFLPAITFSFSLLFLFNIKDSGSLWHNIVLIVSSLLLSNIPTMFLLLIYIVCRDKIKKKNQLNKMNIVDLE